MSQSPQKVNWKVLSYRTIQILQTISIALSPVPLVLSDRYFSSGRAASEQNDIGAPILALLANYGIAMIAISLVFIVRRMMNGPDEREGLLLLFIGTAGFLATFLLYPITYWGLPILVVILGIYNVVIIEKAIRSVNSLPMKPQ